MGKLSFLRRNLCAIYATCGVTLAATNAHAQQMLNLGPLPWVGQPEFDTKSRFESISRRWLHLNQSLRSGFLNFL
jgi:hypothetical protein